MPDTWSRSLDDLAALRGGAGERHVLDSGLPQVPLHQLEVALVRADVGPDLAAEIVAGLEERE